MKLLPVYNAQEDSWFEGADSLGGSFSGILIRAEKTSEIIDVIRPVIPPDRVAVYEALWTDEARTILGVGAVTKLNILAKTPVNYRWRIPLGGQTPALIANVDDSWTQLIGTRFDSFCVAFARFLVSKLTGCVIAESVGNNHQYGAAPLWYSTWDWYNQWLKILNPSATVGAAVSLFIDYPSSDINYRTGNVNYTAKLPNSTANYDAMSWQMGPRWPRILCDAMAVTFTYDGAYTGSELIINNFTGNPLFLRRLREAGASVSDTLIDTVNASWRPNDTVNYLAGSLNVQDMVQPVAALLGLQSLTLSTQLPGSPSSLSRLETCCLINGELPDPRLKNMTRPHSAVKFEYILDKMAEPWTSSFNAREDASQLVQWLELPVIAMTSDFHLAKLSTILEDIRPNMTADQAEAATDISELVGAYPLARTECLLTLDGSLLLPGSEVLKNTKLYELSRSAGVDLFSKQLSTYAGLPWTFKSADNLAKSKLSTLTAISIYRLDERADGGVLPQLNELTLKVWDGGVLNENIKSFELLVQDAVHLDLSIWTDVEHVSSTSLTLNFENFQASSAASKKILFYQFLFLLAGHLDKCVNLVGADSQAGLYANMLATTTAKLGLASGNITTAQTKSAALVDIEVSTEDFYQLDASLAKDTLYDDVILVYPEYTSNEQNIEKEYSLWPNRIVPRLLDWHTHSIDERSRVVLATIGCHDGDLNKFHRAILSGQARRATY